MLVIDWLFPKNCYGCSKPGEYLCNDCIKKHCSVRWDQTCHVCNRNVSVGSIHIECGAQTYLDGVFCMFVYDGLIKKIVHDVKYNFYHDVFNELGVKMAKFSMILPKFEKLVITSVPLNPKKKNFRGFNQSKILAKKVAKYQGVEYLEILKRTKNTKSQVGMSLVERQTNLKNAFKLTSKEILKNFNNLIIVDDVYTTGSTLNECAKLIKSHNQSMNVYAFTLARAPGGVMD
ncbi:MAG: hypothetical protein KatS3mg085_291 [Candidatus Dojkabacteria bacterium]|nr:MAG: hypothetical protein KatS3mg085_291 [Candidatus Dojkabacteria bacterium]GIW58891.1 MAG: hypothetical protein KatS3mg086_176 [Candidatus Dojkabacteria bacterium]